jgi:hypothetical protein
MVGREHRGRGALGGDLRAGSRARWTVLPCPPLPGGWRHDLVDLDVDLGDVQSSGAMVNRVIFRPSADQEVLVVATTDADAVTRRLSTKMKRQLCVVPSRFTCAQIDEV